MFKMLIYLKVMKLYLMPGTSNNGGEDSTWSIISCKASFAHTGSIVNNEGGDFVFHFWIERGRRRGIRILFKNR